jgi:hypothetical protein
MHKPGNLASKYALFKSAQTHRFAAPYDGGEVRKMSAVEIVLGLWRAFAHRHQRSNLRRSVDLGLAEPL